MAIVEYLVFSPVVQDAVIAVVQWCLPGVLILVEYEVGFQEW